MTLRSWPALAELAPAGAIADGTSSGRGRSVMLRVETSKLAGNKGAEKALQALEKRLG